MRIAINTRFLLPSKMEGFGWYTYEVSKRLVENYPQHEFYFFFDRPYDERFVFGKNVKPIVLSPPARHPILFYIWFEWSVKRALKKYQIDLFFSPDGYLSLGSTIPQIATIHDLNYEYYDSDIPKLSLKYIRHFFPKFAKKATKIITVSNYSKTDIQKVYGIEQEKIFAIWNGASDQFKPILEEVKRTIQAKYTNGKPYFLFVGALSPRKNLIRLIQAFDRFKLETGSETKLLIVGEMLWKDKTFSDAISYKNHDEVCFTGHLAIEELAQVMGAAKVFTYVPYFEGFGIPLAEAMKCGVPILSGNLTSLPEVAGDAAIYCDPFDVSEITNRLIELDRDQELLEQLAKKSLERSTLFSWDQCADEVAKVLGL